MRSINPFYAAYQADPARIASEEMESYCAAHPDTPTAVRRPVLLTRTGLWIALLGPTMEEGIVGIGYTVELALRAFDRQYMAGQHPRSGNFSLRLQTAARNSLKDRPSGGASRSLCQPRRKPAAAPPTIN